MLRCALAAAISASGAPIRHAGDGAAFTLLPGPPVERHLTRGEAQRFTIALAAGDYVRIGIDQRGIDVRGTVTGPDGTLVEEAVDGVGPAGEEPVELVAAAAGPYRLSVTAAEGIAAGDYVIRATALRTATAGERRAQDARTLRARARQAERVGHYPEAGALLEQAVEIATAVRGDADTSVAVLLFELAGNALERQENDRARALYDRARAIFDQHWGRAHPYAAMTRSRLALLDERAGQHQKAETAVRDALPTLERTVGVAHPWYLLTLVTLGSLRESAGDLQDAEAIERRAMTTVEQTGQTGTLLEAALVNNLADVMRARGDYAAAEPLFARSLAIGESVLEGDSLFVATALENLGIMARERKDYSAAIADYRRALAIRERLLGPDHPLLAAVLTNLANVYRATGNDTDALATQRRALRVWESSVGPFGRETLLVVGDIARTYAGMGDVEHALLYQRRADAILESQMGLYLATGSERQKLAFARSQGERTDRTISLHLREAPGNENAASLAALVLLQRKGRVEDVMTDVFGAIRQRVADPADRAIFDRLKDTTAELARRAVAGQAASGPPGSIAALEAQREQLEATLSDRIADFRSEIRPVTLEHVQAAIPADAMLLEFAVFRPFDPEAERNEDAYGVPHYAAYLVGQHGSPVGIDLGTADDIDRLVARLRDALRDPTLTDVKARARALDERVMQPLRGSLRGATRLLISPDGDLNLVPFETLVDEHGRYLIERYAATYVTSGRDLLRIGDERGRAGRPVIVADPLFGEPAARARAARPAPADARRSITAVPDMSTLYFAPLSGTALEARAIKSLFPDATLLTGRRASKAALEDLHAPAILHIASHGFFLVDAGAAAAVLAQNPLLRSGLALAGANLPDRARGSGILTAAEAASLDLWGTHLVTLSACDTGLGEVRNGEGVYGLRRAFMLAGAESLVMSLWPVSDSVARDTMVGYYARLRSGAGRGDALRQAKLAILRQPALQHPYYWAGFIQSGDWTPLQPRERFASD